MTRQYTFIKQDDLQDLIDNNEVTKYTVSGDSVEQAETKVTYLFGISNLRLFSITKRFKTL